MCFADFGCKSDDLKGRNSIYGYLPVMDCNSEHFVADLFYKKITFPFVKNRLSFSNSKSNCRRKPTCGSCLLCLPRQHLTHRFRCLLLRCRSHMGIGIQCEPCREVPQHTRHGFHIHAVLEGQRGKRMPLRYNYDKPEKPRISRVFGYLARFFILFQTEKSSREVVIS